MNDFREHISALPTALVKIHDQYASDLSESHWSIGILTKIDDLGQSFLEPEVRMDGGHWANYALSENTDDSNLPVAQAPTATILMPEGNIYDDGEGSMYYHYEVEGNGLLTWLFSQSLDKAFSVLVETCSSADLSRSARFCLENMTAPMCTFEGFMGSTPTKAVVLRLIELGADIHLPVLRHSGQRVSAWQRILGETLRWHFDRSERRLRVTNGFGRGNGDVVEVLLAKGANRRVMIPEEYLSKDGFEDILQDGMLDVEELLRRRL